MLHIHRALVVLFLVLAGTAWAEEDPLDQIRLTLRTQQYIDSRQPGVGGSKPPPIQPMPYVADLVALPVLDSPLTIRMLGEKDNVRLSMNRKQVFEMGLLNLRRTLPPLMEVAQPVATGQIGHLTGDPYEASRILLFDTWAALAKAQGGVLIVAVPATDTLFYLGEDTSDAIAALRNLAKNVQAAAPNPLSTTLLRWREKAWEVVPE